MLEFFFFLFMAFMFAGFAGFCVGRNNLPERRQSFFFALLLIGMCLAACYFFIYQNWYKYCGIN